MTSEKERKYQREWRRKRRQSDPDFVEREREAKRRWHEKIRQDPEQHAAYKEKCRQWELANPKKYKATTRRGALLRNYGLTEDAYNRMLEQQNFKCAICGDDNPGYGRKNWVVDHDHSTGSTRGLLCQECNLALGLVQDSVDILESMIEYLKIHAPPPKK